MKTTTLLIITVLISLSGCLKPDDGFTTTLPPITTTGENTFGCYVDGELLTPRDGTGYIGVPDRGMRFIAGPSPDNVTYRELHVRDFKSGSGGILKLHIFNFDQFTEGEFIINESNCQDGISANENINITCRWWDENTQVFKWYCSIENGGSLNILRNDFDNYIFSGTFKCTVQNQDDPNDIIEITDGRFDIDRTTLINTYFP